ncbi:MAG: efflux transporter outer membrane subunit, partial [Stenotrophobium sp.]
MSPSNRIFTAASAPVLALLMAGCSVGPDYARPQAPATRAYTAQPLSNLSGGSGQQLVPGQNPATDWWTLFESPALDATMKQALSGNRSLAAATASLAQAQEAVNASGGGLYPQASLNAGAGREKYGAQFSGPQVIPAFTYFSIGPSVSYLFDYTGGQRRAVEQQQALADYSACQLQAAYLSLTGNVARQALAIASARARIAATQALLDDDAKNVALVQTAQAAGSATRVDVLSAQSQLAGDETLLPPLRQQLNVAQHALSILAGRAPADWTPPDFDLDGLRLPQTLPLSLPSELAHRRPDILAAEAQLHAATAAVGVATSHLYPQIGLSASAGPQSTSLSHLFDATNVAWGLSTGLTAPLFDGGTLRAQRRGSIDAMHAALADYEQTVLQSFGQVADVLSALDHDAEHLAAQQKALDLADASLKLTRE